MTETRRKCHPLDRIDGCEACEAMRLAAVNDEEPQTDGPLCDCGYPEGSFPCRIRHINVNVENLRRGH